MSTWTIVGELGSCEGGSSDLPLLSAADLGPVTGWVSKAEGWCRGAECIPSSLLGSVASDPSAPARSIAAALGAAYAADETHRVAVIGNRSDTSSSLVSGIAPDLALMGLDGRPHTLFEQSAGKTLVVAFSSWCGCRYDLPGWQSLRNELAGQSFDVVGVAIDESTEDVAPWATDIDFPVLVDTDRTFADAYGLTNVPTVIWLDENRRVVRSPSIEFSDDQFTSIHGVESGPHLESVRRWVLDGTVPDQSSVDVGEFSVAQRQARAEFRLALELLRREAPEAAARHIAAADVLAPDDFTIWRAGMKLVGEDPFGADFFDRYTEWQQRHGGPLQVKNS